MMIAHILKSKEEEEKKRKGKRSQKGNMTQLSLERKKKLKERALTKIKNSLWWKKKTKA